MRIAVLGLGLMGRAVAERLLKTGHAVTGWNRSPCALDALMAEGMRRADTAAAAVMESEIVLLLLADAQAIGETLPADGALKDRTVIQMGTIAPDESRAIARRVESQGGAYLEAPVLGSLPEARGGRLIVMAGGDAALYDRCLPLLRTLGEAPRRVGGVGQGAALKLAMNQLIAALTTGFSLSLGLVRSEGVEVTLFMELLRTSALYAPTFDKKLEKYLRHDYAQANFPLKHLIKDIGLFRRVAESRGMETGVPAAMQALFERAAAAGWADADYSALYEAAVSAGGSD